MRKKLILLCTSMMLVSCGNPAPFIKNNKLPVILEESSDYRCSENTLKIEKGEDASFVVQLKEGDWIESCSYKDYEITKLGSNKFRIDLKNVNYPTYVTLNIEYEKITYDGNGGVNKNNEEIVNLKKNNWHLRENAHTKMNMFSKDGYVSTGFNVEKDGSGEHIGFGSRIPYGVTTLYYEWEKETPLDDFNYHNDNGRIYLDSYIGSSKKVVIPASKEKVFLSDYVFKDKEIDTLILSNNVDYIGKKTFDGAKINELYIPDNNTDVPGESLDKCGIRKVHINAATSTGYSGTYYDAFQDKMDYLYKIKDEKKFVLFGGSSVRYGYNSEMIREAFPSYNVVNMGVYAYVNAIPEIEIITKFMSSDDYLIHSPEFDNHAVKQQFCMTDNFEFNEFALFESNYEMLSMLDLSKYPTFFTSYEEFLKSRMGMDNRDYSFKANDYDDDGNYHFEDVYNIYGDMAFYREGHSVPDEKIFQPWCDHTLENITPEAIECLNKIYDKLNGKGINTLFTYYPKNRYCLTEASTLEKRTELENYLNENLRVPVISKMEDYLFDANYFYLIDNHLSTEGATIRTNRFISDLKAYGIK